LENTITAFITNYTRDIFGRYYSIIVGKLRKRSTNWTPTTI